MMKRILLVLCSSYVALLLLLSGVMMIVSMVPHERVAAHMVQSCSQLRAEGLYPEQWGIPLMRIDTFTDALMLNMAWCADDTTPIRSAMLNRFYTDDDMQVFDRTMDLVSSHASDGFYMPYGRYWHGHQTIVRPLLTVTDYAGILRFGKWCFWILLALTLWLVGRRLSWSMAVILGASLLLTSIWCVPECIQFSTCFYLSFLGIIVVLQWPWTVQTSMRFAVTFFVVGALTTFFDILTTPQVTLCLPLLMVLLRSERNVRLHRFLLGTISWGLGYAMLWLSKCVIAWLLTGENVVADFLQNARSRSLAGVSGLLDLLSEKIPEIPWHSLSLAATLFILLLMVITIMNNYLVYSTSPMISDPSRYRKHTSE